MPSCVCLAHQRLTCTHTHLAYTPIYAYLSHPPTQMHLHLSHIVYCVGIPCTFSVFSSKRSNRARKKSRNTCGMWTCVGVCYEGSHFERKNGSPEYENPTHTWYTICPMYIRARFQSQPIQPKQSNEKFWPFFSSIENSREISIRIGFFSKIHANWYKIRPWNRFSGVEKTDQKSMCAAAAAAVYPCISKNPLHKHSTHFGSFALNSKSVKLCVWVSECMHASVSVYVW